MVFGLRAQSQFMIKMHSWRQVWTWLEVSCFVKWRACTSHSGFQRYRQFLYRCTGISKFQLPVYTVFSYTVHTGIPTFLLTVYRNNGICRLKPYSRPYLSTFLQFSKPVHLKCSPPIDKVVNRDRLQYTCTRLRGLKRWLHYPTNRKRCLIISTIRSDLAR